MLWVLPQPPAWSPSPARQPPWARRRDPTPALIRGEGEAAGKPPWQAAGPHRAHIRALGLEFCHKAAQRVRELGSSSVRTAR